MTKGNNLLASWIEAKERGLTQERHAEELGLPYTTYKSRMYRAMRDSEPDTDIATPAVDTRSYAPVLLKAAVFDIEVMDFSSGGLLKNMICTSILPLDSQEAITLSINFDDAGDDRRLLQDVIQELAEYDILIGHNIIAFDFNWINSRLMYHDLPPMPKRWLYYDTYQAAKRMAIKADRKSLAFLGDYFRIENDKTAVLPIAWQRCASRKKAEFCAGLADVVDHCERDVLLNRQLFYALWPRDRSFTSLPFTRKW